MTSQPLVLSRHDEVRAALADPALTVVAAPRPPFALTVAWLRGAVGRFADGALHAGRRAAAVEVLAGLDARALRAEAFARASCLPADAPAVELVAVEVLAVALGVGASEAGQAARAVAAIAPAYLPAPAGPSGQDTAAADAAVAGLSRLLGDPAPERLAVLAGLLAQACDATTALIRNALAADAPACPVEDLLTETLRHDPPVRVLRRGAARPVPADTAAAEVTVLLDLAAANRDPLVFDDPGRFRPGRTQGHLTFGAGPRPCPAQEVALALAAGVVEAVRR